MNPILVKRFKSFLWRLGGMVLATILAFVADNLGLFGFSPEVTVVLGLVIGEVTKWLNKNAG